MSHKITAKYLRDICDTVEANVSPILARCEAAAQGGEEYIIYCDILTTNQIKELLSRDLTVKLTSEDDIIETYRIGW